MFGLGAEKPFARRGLLACALVAGAGLLVAPPPARADITVADTAQPAANPFALPGNPGELLQASGRQAQIARIRIGSFLLLNKAGASSVYDDNVFAGSGKKDGDLFTSAEAQMSLASTWKRHSLEVYVGGGGNFYADLPDENVGFANVGARTRLDMGPGDWLKAFGNYKLGYETRGTGESFQPFKEPIQTQAFEGGALLHNSFERVWTEFGFNGRHKDYFDTKLLAAGVVTAVDQSFRDGSIGALTARLGYEFSPKTSAFLESIYETRDYDDARFDTDGYKLLAGLRVEMSRYIEADAAVGFMSYEGARALADIDTWTFHAQLLYAISPTVTAGLVGSRELGAPSLFSGASNVVESEIGVRADYAVRRDVLLMAGAGYGWADYVDTAREDKYLRLTAGAEYQLYPWLMLWANYAYIQHESNLAAPDIDFDKSVIRVGLQARY